MIYPIVAYGDPVLKKKCREIEEGEMDVKKISDNLFDTMNSANGVGLAGPQVGMDLRIFVVDGTPMEGEDCENFVQVFVNPEILEESGDLWSYNEGCLSIPEIHEDVKRHDTIRIRYYDENWEKHEEVYKGMVARIIQHEYDHIEGVLFTDHLSGMKRRLLKGKLANISRGKIKVKYRMKFPLKK